MTSTVTEGNQVRIPPDIACEFNIHPGTQLAWAKAGEGVIAVTPVTSRGEWARQLLGAGRRWLKPGADPSGDLLRDREEDARSERIP